MGGPDALPKMEVIIAFAVVFGMASVSATPSASESHACAVGGTTKVIQTKLRSQNYIMTEARRFPPPWSVEEHSDARF